MDTHFDEHELTELRAHGIVLHAGRVIFDARSPLAPAELEAIQRSCDGLIPDELLALWRQTAGGRLDYDLYLRMKGHEEALSWTELFALGGASDLGDLRTWIEHERATGDAGPPGAAGIAALPIGGFESSDRFYVDLRPGLDHGRLLAWKQGLPQAWSHALHEDVLAPLAPGLGAAFSLLHLEEDPLALEGMHATGQSLLAYLDERHESHGLSIELMDKLVDFYRQAMVDWRAALDDGSLASQGRLARIALRHAIAMDDEALVRRLADAGVPLDEPLQGSALPTDLALGQGAHAAAMALLLAGAAVAPDALEQIDSAISPELAGQLLKGGARPSAAAIVDCAACGAPLAAHRIADAYAQRYDDLPAAFAKARNERLAQLEAELADLRTGERTHYLGAPVLAERIAHLRQFEP